jgi:hypothetical protein
MPGARFSLPPISGYDQFEVVSALRKTIKLGDKAAAIYWLNVLLENNLAKKAARNLWIMAAEDIDEPMIVIRAFAVFMMVSKVAETDHQYYLVAAMCDAPKIDPDHPKSNEERLVELCWGMAYARKWWESDDGVEANRLWSQAIGDLKVKERRRPIPEVALDQHTRRGKALARRTGAMRDELSGTDKGQMKTLFQFLADGKLDEHRRVLDSEPGFQELYELQQQLQGNRRATPVPKPDEPPNEDLFGGSLGSDEPPRRLGYHMGCENWREWA